MPLLLNNKECNQTHLSGEISGFTKVIDELVALGYPAVYIIAFDCEHKGWGAVPHHVRLEGNKENNGYIYNNKTYKKLHLKKNVPNIIQELEQ